MQGVAVSEHALFGGAISCSFPNRFQSVSDIRDVPDNQEVFADPVRDESIIIELLELKQEVADEQSAVWFLRDLATEQDAHHQVEIDAVYELEEPDAPFLDPSIVKNAAVGRMAVSKARQGAEASNVLKVYLGNVRLRNVSTDLLISVNEPVYISALSESAAAVGAGPTIPATVAGCMPAQEVFQLILRTFKIHDWNLFSS